MSWRKRQGQIARGYRRNRAAACVAGDGKGSGDGAGVGKRRRAAVIGRHLQNRRSGSHLPTAEAEGGWSQAEYARGCAGPAERNRQLSSRHVGKDGQNARPAADLGGRECDLNRAALARLHNAACTVTGFAEVAAGVDVAWGQRDRSGVPDGHRLRVAGAAVDLVRKGQEAGCRGGRRYVLGCCPQGRDPDAAAVGGRNQIKHGSGCWGGADLDHRRGRQPACKGRPATGSRDCAVGDLPRRKDSGIGGDIHCVGVLRVHHQAVGRNFGQIGRQSCPMRPAVGGAVYRLHIFQQVMKPRNGHVHRLPGGVVRVDEDAGNVQPVVVHRAGVVGDRAQGRVRPTGPTARRCVVGRGEQMAGQRRAAVR